jgi:hypothetical protein
MSLIKKLTIVIMMTFPLLGKSDILSDIINGYYREPVITSYDSAELGENHDLDNGEVYHWDEIYLCTYCYDTEVILDLYESNNEVGFYD